MEIDIVMPEPHEKQRRVKNTAVKRVVICAGRRGGKTAVATQVSIEKMLQGRRVLLASATQEQADQFWDKAKEWLANPLATSHMTKNESRRIIEASNGGRIRAKTAWNADSLRGDYGDFLVLDEAALMDADAWEDVAQPMLLDNDGTAWIVSTPPKSNVNQNWFTKRYRSAQKKDDWEAFHFTSYDNPHLSEAALKRLTKDMTQAAYRREIMAEFVEPEGALWDWDNIPREDSPPNMDRIVIGVDPAGGGPDEVGIVACGKSGGLAYVLEDASMKGSPNAWASTVASVYRRHKADRVVAEKNYGGDMVKHTLSTANRDLPVSVISASRGKKQRAEPVAALYEQGKVYHVGTHERLEDQMTTWDPAESDTSPDRVDGLVWALTELMVDSTQRTGGGANIAL